MSGPTIPTRFAKEKCALVLIDVQEKFRDLIYDMPAVTASCSRLLRFCDRLEIPIVVAEHYPEGLGKTLPELMELIPEGSVPLEKITFSCADNNEFNERMESLDRKQIILCGLETHVCVYQTACDLLLRGLQVAVAMDAVSSRSRQNRENGFLRMRELGAQIMSVEMILFEILKKAKTDDFKSVAGILKET